MGDSGTMMDYGLLTIATSASSADLANWGGDFLDTLSRYDGLQAIRLNPLGAYALDLTDTYEPAEPEPVLSR